VLIEAIREGVKLLTWQLETFAYAENFDEHTTRYRGLRGGQVVSLTRDGAGVLVKPDVARRQMNAEAPGTTPSTGGGTRSGTGEDDPGVGGRSGEAAGTAQAVRPEPPRPRRFHGTVELDPARVGRDASRIADEVIAHLTGQIGAQVRVTLEIEATLPDGASDHVTRTVTENSRTLKFTSHGFESE
jgi:hypothetical protein